MLRIKAQVVLTLSKIFSIETGYPMGVYSVKKYRETGTEVIIQNSPLLQPATLFYENQMCIV